MSKVNTHSKLSQEIKPAKKLLFNVNVSHNMTVVLSIETSLNCLTFNLSSVIALFPLCHNLPL